jgi:amidase
VLEDAPPYDWDRFLDTVHVIWTAFTALSMDGVAGALGRTPTPDSVEAVTWKCYEDGKRASALDLLIALDHHNAVSRQVAPFFQGVDAFLTPTISRPPAPLGEIDQNKAGLSAIDWTRQVFDYVPFTALYNTTGQPAISLPLHWTPQNVPIGVQFAGRFGDESTLLRLASQLEQARPWRDKRAGLHV